MNSRTGIEYECLKPELVQEARHVLQELSAGGRVTVSLSSELARIVAKFLTASSEEGAIGFGPINPELTPEQAAIILDIDLVLLERRIGAGVLPCRELGGQTTINLVDVLDLKRNEEARNNLLVEINRAMENSDAAGSHPPIRE
ncbi:hypothetical protein [Sinorhizobium mexicanum]|uniref:Uncharacterized protein n=1 Tax=Sinorhizobium mexicanum TaxID=375549 RepID=A0A859QCX4_9HYPH|nr:hypothetical protein [Sinorhizobium mexicanum]MBP1881820.1 hypothetical protein [Sinorhizobium mexicanum]QLL61572.1 hypothetical protein FKV68_08980 [Sinorhizobium mexicanum]